LSNFILLYISLWLNKSGLAMDPLGCQFLVNISHYDVEKYSSGKLGCLHNFLSQTMINAIGHENALKAPILTFNQKFDSNDIISPITFLKNEIWERDWCVALKCIITYESFIGNKKIHKEQFNHTVLLRFDYTYCYKGFYSRKGSKKVWYEIAADKNLLPNNYCLLSEDLLEDLEDLNLEEKSLQESLWRQFKDFLNGKPIIKQSDELVITVKLLN